MAFTKLTKDMNIIQKLDDEPNDIGGLTSEQLKAKFDESGNAVKDWINNVFIPEAERELGNALLGQIDPAIVTPEKVGALALDGSNSMTGNLNIVRASYPTVLMKDATKGSGGMLQLSGNIFSVGVQNVSGDENDSRLLRVYTNEYFPDLKNALRFRDTVSGTGKEYPIHHDGNKPYGNYTGNGDAAQRTVDTKGIGGVLVVRNSNGFAIVTTSGVIAKRGTTLYALTAGEAKFSGGVLTLATTDTVLNANGVVSNYDVL